MSRAATDTAGAAASDGAICYRLLFPDFSDPRPLSFFMLENLLAARADSRFPSNSCGPDEAVNVYLADLLTGKALNMAFRRRRPCCIIPTEVVNMPVMLTEDCLRSRVSFKV